MQFENSTPLQAEMTGGLAKSGHEYIVVAVKGTFVLPERVWDPVCLAPVQEPLFLADEFGQDPAEDATIFENDFAPFKPYCDVLSEGPAIVPHGGQATQIPVGIRLGNWSKHFIAHGSRIWLDGAYKSRVSDPRPFRRQQIGYDQAYGGTDADPDTPGHARTYETNPVGSGYYPLRDDIAGLPLSNTGEPSKDPVERDGDYVPMAFGPLGRAWLPRRGWAGTYDEAWIEDKMPFLPDDFDDRYFQAASPDQWIPYPEGNEVLELLHLTETERIQTRLPPLGVEIDFTRKSGRVTRKIANLDTVLILGERMRLCLTWRARFLTERDIFEIAKIDISVRGELPPALGGTE